MKKQTTAFIAVILAASMLLSGCGLGKEKETSGTEEPSQSSVAMESSAAAQIPVESIEFQKDPTSAAPVETTSNAPAESASPEESSSESGTIPQGTKVIALTFDDGPDMRYTSSTSRILDVLEEYNVKATFFVQGIQLTYKESSTQDGTGESFAERNQKILKRASDLGMEIGTHSYDHPQLTAISTSEVQEQIRKSCDLIRSVTGKDPTLIRPPYGDADNAVLNAVDLPFIIWDVDTLDWQTKDPDQTVQNTLSQAKGGSIVLMHDIYNTTADAVELLVPKLLDAGYKLVTVSELFAYYGVPLENHHIYMNARGD